MRILDDFGRKLGRENVRCDVSQCMIIHMQIYTRYFNMQGMKPAVVATHHPLLSPAFLKAIAG